MKRVLLKHEITMAELLHAEDDGVNEIFTFKAGGTYQVIHTFETTECRSGKAVVIFDGYESVTVDAGLVKEVFE